MPTELNFWADSDANCIGLKNNDQNYLLWQSEESNVDGVYFEYNDQINSGYGITKAVTIDDTGCVVTLRSGESVVFDWEWPMYGDIDEFIVKLKVFFEKEAVEVLDSQGFYRR